MGNKPSSDKNCEGFEDKSYLFIDNIDNHIEQDKKNEKKRKKIFSRLNKSSH